MNKKFWLFTLLFLVAGTLAQAQQPKKVPRIGYLTASTPVAQLPGTEALREGLREFGYVEGQNIAIEFRYAEEKPERLPALGRDGPALGRRDCHGWSNGNPYRQGNNEHGSHCHVPG